MNREQEYLALRRELDQAPPALDHTLDRAKTRLSRRRRTLFPAGGLCACALLFVLLVNMSTTFALACSRVPVLRELAAAVAFSPSLSEAVRHNYVQLIDQSQTQNGVTATVAYVIVDERQLHIFYTLELQDEAQAYLTAVPALFCEDGAPLSGAILTYGSPDEHELHQITVDIVEGDMPDRLLLTLPVYRYPSEVMSEPLTGPSDADQEQPAATFDFELSFDSSRIRKGKILTLEQAFVLDGQTLTLTTMEIYPTHLRLNLRADPQNTAWLKGLVFSLEDAQGHRFSRSGGISATGEPGTPAMLSYRLESPYFYESDQMTLRIEGALWLDKDKERMRVDLANAAADNLPEEVSIRSITKQANGWELIFEAPRKAGHSAQMLFLSTYYDEQGTPYSFQSWSSDTQGGSNGEGTFSMRFELANYDEDVVWLSPAYTRMTTLPEPLQFSVRG